MLKFKGSNYLCLHWDGNSAAWPNTEREREDQRTLHVPMKWAEKERREIETNGRKSSHAWYLESQHSCKSTGTTPPSGPTNHHPPKSL